MRWIAASAAALALAAIIHLDTQDQADQRQRYCQMVEIWEKSGGEYGWPPYEGECK